MGRFISAVVAVAVILGLLWVVNQLTATQANITCKQQVGTQYALCLSGQPHQVYVPYSVWRSAVVGGYYDKGTRTAYRSAGDDPHVSHGLFGHGGAGEEGHVSVHVGGE